MSTGFSFGSNTQPAGSITFGTPLSTQTSTTPQLGLGVNAAQPQTSLFGSAPSTTTSALPGFNLAPTATSGGLTFGTPATAPTGLSFGTSQNTTSGLNFGAPAPTAATSTFTPGSLSLTGNTGFLGSGTTTGLSFGTTTVTSTSSAPGLNFGLSAPATSAGLGALNTSFLKATTTCTAATTTSQAVGLGGVVTQQKVGTTAAGLVNVSPKNLPLPNEIQQTVDNFKKFVAEQKSCSSDVARCSIKDFKKVETDIDAANNLLHEVETQLQKNLSVTEKLKYDTAKGLQNIEMAQRTHETPPGLQYENTAPIAFFNELADNYEREMLALKIQIENTSKYIKNIDCKTTLTSQDLAMGMRRLHETFVALAGRLQTVHSQVELQKEQYLNLRKNLLHDDTNVFDAPVKQAENFNITLNDKMYTPPKNAFGPSPFSNTEHTSFIASAAGQNPPPYPGTSFGLQQTSQPSFGMSLPASTFGGSTSFGQPSFQFSTPLSTSFQLQKPPVGNKRGKQ